jgi:magnesium transporter
VAATIDRVLKNSAAVARAPDRLTYTLLDLLLDHYQPALDDMAREFSTNWRAQLLSGGRRPMVERIFRLKNEVRRVRQIMAPQREVIARLARGEFKLVRAHLLPYYRDLLDRLNRMTMLAETYRDSLTDTLQVHLNLQQMQVNKVIKVLTVMATLTVPFLAITSFYGMNIRHMPNPMTGRAGRRPTPSFSA